MHISLDTNELSAVDMKMLSALVGDQSANGWPKETVDPEPAAEPKTRRTRKTAEAKKEPEAVEESAAAESPGASDGPTLDDALAAASILVDAKKTDVVRSTLQETFGVKKVSELNGAQFGEFIDLIQPAIDELQKGE